MLFSKIQLFGVRIIYIISFLYSLSIARKVKFKSVFPLFYLIFPQLLLLITCFLQNINNITYSFDSSIKFSFAIWILISLIGYYLEKRIKASSFLFSLFFLIILSIILEISSFHEYYSSAGINERVFVIITLTSIYIFYSNRKFLSNLLSFSILFLCLFLDARFSTGVVLILILYINFKKFFYNQNFLFILYLIIPLLYFTVLFISPNYSDIIRLSFTYNGLSSFLNNPLLGSGFSNVNIINNITLQNFDYHKSFPNWFPNCHNNYIQLLSDFGVISILAFLPILITYITRRYLFFPFFIILVYSLSISCYVIPLFWFIYGFTISYYFPLKKHII